LFAGLAAVLTIRHVSPSAASAEDAPRAQAGKSILDKDIAPFLKKNCYACHGTGKVKAGLSFVKFKDDVSVYQDRKTWDSVLQMLESGEMPPKSRPKPDLAESEAVVKSIRGLFDGFDRTAKPNVGRVTIRRLNRTEYNNTIRDLVGVDFKPAEDFPADDVGYGFDNIGDVLSVSPLLLEKYLSAAELILDQTIVIVDPPKVSRQKIDVTRNRFRNSGTQMGGAGAFDEGDYIIRCKVAADQAGDEPVKVKLTASGKMLKEFEVKGPADNSTSQELKVRMNQGSVRLTVTLLNPTVNPPEKGPKRAIYVRSLEIEGPFNPPPPPRSESYRRLMAHKDGLPPREAAREIITRFATLAFRRPVRPAEVDRCLALYDASAKKGRRFELCVRTALYRVMVSPNFLFRVELDPPNLPPNTPYAINEYELASRLSYFLWNSMPDAELTALAGKGELRKNLAGQIVRMTKDAKSKSFLENFAEQWLTLRRLELASPDPKLFPKFTRSLRDAMARESKMFFEAVVREDRSVLDLLDADFTFVNGELARHYGIEGVKGNAFVRVKAPKGRGGILTQAAFLTLTSNATRSSPVKRGKFILEQVLNTPPPPPPPNVPELENQKELKGTLRQVMEQHRANAVCASCHRRMDPLGFAFENFDAVGAWRDKDGTADVDASGELPDGRKFTGADGLKKLMKENNRLFVRCLTEKMLTYALGRGLEVYDRRAVDGIVEAVTKNDYRFAVLISEIVKSDPFQMRMTGEAR
jgi:mono/diheme cytochrome c family protein